MYRILYWALAASAQPACSGLLPKYKALELSACHVVSDSALFLSEHSLIRLHSTGIGNAYLYRWPRGVPSEKEPLEVFMAVIGLQ